MLDALKQKTQQEREFLRYLETLSESRRVAMSRLRRVILNHLPAGFVEIFQKNGCAYVVPHTLYPPGYHCAPKSPLPFMSMASQKQHIALHHMGLYASKDLTDWFMARCAEEGVQKIGKGKGCIRFKAPEHLPFEAVGELAEKISPNQWIAMYEKARLR